MVAIDLGVPQERIAEFCRRWKINRLAVFGSVVRGKLRADSDIDLLVTFASEAGWSMFDHYRMEDELVDLFGREAIEENTNPIFRRQILGSAREIYAA